MKHQVGFIGLGIMGRPMALNLAKAGFSLSVFNRSRSKAEDLASDRIRILNSPAEVAACSGITITIVSNNAAVEEVITGPDGVLEGVRPGSIVVDMSTVAPALEQSLSLRLEEKSSTLIDAPVSGGDVGARKGTLAIMAGGPREAFDRVLPLFEAMGKTITYCGPVGHGQLTKLCNQILVSANLLGVCEAIAFAKGSGLDAKIMIEAVQGGAAGSWQLSNLGPRIVEEDFEPGFMVDLMQKDLGLVVEAAEQASLSLAATSLVHQFLDSAQDQGLGRKGTQVLAQIVQKLSAL